MLKANKLKSNEAQKKMIQKEIDDILIHIDDELKMAHEKSEVELITTLPITFSIPFISNSETQRRIYSSVLSSLLQRDFHPKIKLNKDSTMLYIKWLNDQEENDAKIQSQLLAKYTILDNTDIKL